MLLLAPSSLVATPCPRLFASPIQSPAGTARVRLANPAPYSHPPPFARKFIQLNSQIAHSSRYVHHVATSYYKLALVEKRRPCDPQLEDPTDSPSKDSSIVAAPGPIAPDTPAAKSTYTFDKRSPNPAPTQRHLTSFYSTLRPHTKSEDKLANPHS
jgi:hypothetical protein